MKKQMIMGAIALLLIAAVCIAGCATTTSPSNQTATGNATRTANVTANVTTGTPVTAQQGQNFTITLQVNPSTGYQWKPESNANLTLVNQTYVPTQPVMPGSGGSDVFTFQGLKTGTTTLAFDNVSPSGTVANRTLYTVTITPTSSAETFAITLPSNPSTGYQWKPQFDTSALTLKGQAYEPTQPVIPGSGGSDVFTFQVLKAGATTITFDNVSPSGTVTRTTSVGVMITPATGGQAQTVAITLQANPSTGYEWQPRFDANAVTLTSRTYEPTQPVIPGSGGSDVFTFQVLKAGATTITFDNVSPAGTVTNSIGLRLL